jgi:hypothetical protein
MPFSHIFGIKAGGKALVKFLEVTRSVSDNLGEHKFSNSSAIHH